MKILLDQCVPENLKFELSGFQVSHPKDHLWEKLENGDLLKAAEKNGYECFLTCDLNMRKYQRMSGRKMAMLEFSPQSWPELKNFLNLLRREISTMQTGEYRQVDLRKIAADILKKARKKVP